MSEIEPVSNREEPPPPTIPATKTTTTTNDETSVDKDGSQKEQSSLPSPPNPNGPASTRSSAPSTPGATHTAPAQVKRFSSANINQKFLQKVSSAHSSTPSSPAQPASSPAQTTSTSVPATAGPHGSNTGSSRFVTTRLTQTAVSAGAKWQKDSTGQATKPAATGADASSTKLGSLSTKGAPIAPNRAQNGQSGPAWTSLSGNAKANPHIAQNDFPTAAELRAKAEKAAANSAAQRRSLDAFRGVHLDPNAQHWDEMTEEEDFLSGVIEFGDGKQYTVAPTAAPDAKERSESSQTGANELGDGKLSTVAPTADTEPDAKERNGSSQPAPRKPPVSSPQAATAHPDRTLHNPPPARPSPTLLNATPFGRGGPARRGSDTRPFRDGPAWGAQRNSYVEPPERDRDFRGRRPSTSERDRLPPSPAGALGPHLRDRSPDGSGRFPGRTIVPHRRDSQASSAVIGPSRSTRALSRESSDRSNVPRQLPPHLEQAHDGSSLGPPASSRNHWRESPTSTRPPPNAIHDSRPPLPSTVADKDVASALIGDEEALKTAMAVAAERARKRRQEEEEERERQRERAKQKLLELEARMQAEKDEKDRKVKEEEERLKRVKEEKEKSEREEAEREKERVREQHVKERVTQTRPSRPPAPSERAESWRTSAPRFLSTTEGSQKPANEVHEPRRPPIILQKARPSGQPSPVSHTKEKPAPDLSGKPASSAAIPELTALQSPDSDGPVEVLDFADLRQLAEGFNGSLSVSTLPVNGVESSPSAPLVNLRSTTESQPGRNQYGRRDSLPRSHPGPQVDDAHSRHLKSTRAQPPAPLVLGHRGSHDTGHPHSAALSSARSPRTFDPNNSYKEAPISVLDDTMSRFKTALMHSNPIHAGMSSDAIMLGLERAETEELVRAKNAKVLAEHALITSQPTWCQTQEGEVEEDDEGLNVLIPTLSLNREPVPPKQLALIRSVEQRPWDCLTFEPPVPHMSKRTLSVFEALTDGSKIQTSIRIRVPGSAPRDVTYHSRPSRPVVTERPRRLERPDTRPGNSSITPIATAAVGNNVSAMPKSAPLNTQWPPKNTKGSDETVWRRAVPIHSAAESEKPVVPEPVNPPTPKSAPLQKHNRAFSSPLGTPSMSSTWGRSPLSLPVTEEIPDDPSLKAAWNKASQGAEAATTKNSLMDIADEPPPAIPSSISELRSEDGDRSKAPERRATPPLKAKYDPHRAFQQVTPQSPLPQQMASPAAPPVSIPSPYPTPRTNALALTTHKTPSHTPPGSLPPPAPPAMMPGRPPFPATYSSPLLPNATPFNQAMVGTPQYAPPTPMAPPLTPGMLHRGVNQPMQMPSTPSMTPMWAPQTPGSSAPLHGAYMRQPMPPPITYQGNMIQQQQQQAPPPQPPLQLYMPQSGMLPPSPGVSPLMPPGMNKPFPGPRTSIGSNGPMQMPMGYPSPQSQGPYMMGNPMLPPLAPQQQQQHQQQPLPHARIPQMPQGRGMPMQVPPYPQMPPGGPGGYSRPW